MIRITQQKSKVISISKCSFRLVKGHQVGQKSLGLNSVRFDTFEIVIRKKNIETVILKGPKLKECDSQLLLNYYKIILCNFS